MLAKSKPEDAERLWRLAQQDVERRYRTYEYLAARKETPVPTRKSAEKAAPAAEKPTPAGSTG